MSRRWSATSAFISTHTLDNTSAIDEIINGRKQMCKIDWDRPELKSSWINSSLTKLATKAGDLGPLSVAHAQFGWAMC